MYRKSFILISVTIVVNVFTSGCGNSVESVEESAEAKLPSLLRARALSNHYVTVSFAGVVGEEAEDPLNYKITGPGNRLLAVREARLMDDGLEVLLWTDPQDSVEYTIALNPLRVSTSVVDVGSIGSIGFAGSLNRERFWKAQSLWEARPFC